MALSYFDWRDALSPLRLREAVTPYRHSCDARNLSLVTFNSKGLSGVRPGPRLRVQGRRPDPSGAWHKAAPRRPEGDLRPCEIGCRVVSARSPGMAAQNTAKRQPSAE